jgi:hypothetical protein
VVFVIKPFFALCARFEFRRKDIGLLLVTRMSEADDQPQRIVCRQMEMLAEFIKLDGMCFI